ncbi:helix-turn-helix transcriptional regulator [Achromobacter denitrificans]
MPELNRPSSRTFDASVSKLVNKKELCELLAVSDRTIENMVKAGAFPPPVRIGKYTYWSELAIRRWQEQRFAGQENWMPVIGSPNMPVLQYN